MRSSQSSNLAYAVACGRAGAHRINDGGRSRVERSRAVRDAVRNGWDPVTYATASGETVPTDTPRLF